ncbi:MAG TPA: hypothetical protein VI524_09745, partial [Anaerolineales bacterium]|nr:hypothetical protein [Anaerolineales bacterium]
WRKYGDVGFLHRSMTPDDYSVPQQRPYRSLAGQPFYARIHGDTATIQKNRCRLLGYVSS